MYTYLSVFGSDVYSYGLCLCAGALLGLALMGLLSRRAGLKRGTAGVFGVIAIPLGLICARLLFCAVNIGYFTDVCENPLYMLNFFDGGLSMYGLFIGLAIAAAICARVTKAGFWDITDALCAPLALFVALERYGEMFTDLGVGKIIEANALTDAAPWLFIIERAGKSVEYRMAVHCYEIGFAVLLLALLLVIRLTRGLRSGELTLYFLAVFGAAQVLFESLRDDGHMMYIFLRVGQLCAVIMPLVAAGVMSRRRRLALGGLGRRGALVWAGLALCVAVLVLVEFSLDGRLTLGAASPVRDYMIMLAACAALCVLPLSLNPKGGASVAEAK